jgi:hypothetical protein
MNRKREYQMKANDRYDRYYLSYSGVSLPLKLVSQLDNAEINNRNTFFGAICDANGREEIIHKVVYGEVELIHAYTFNQQGTLTRAEITDIDGETQVLTFA